MVNALAMMSPYGPAEKQALLEAPNLKTRAEILIAVTEMDLAKKKTSGDPPLKSPDARFLACNVLCNRDKTTGVELT